ncbi:hypothetical protein E2562_031720 [Oryza meyeriana var. granulata]|uniref:Uncharacterized protein n=1 Tax=Oryza meyeriana var. granulata TaxID=110450 RepID=A0A6G1FED8_9ORYZ|nr:hypothetical protein E2562_031720 [Oryza meyeriana var. granulata]
MASRSTLGYKDLTMANDWLDPGVTVPFEVSFKPLRHCFQSANSWVLGLELDSASSGNKVLTIGLEAVAMTP